MSRSRTTSHPLSTELAANALATHHRSASAHKKKGREAIALVLDRRRSIGGDFLDIADALRVLRDPKVIAALGRTSFAELCELDLDMSLGKALQLVALGERLERGLVLELGQERASALLELADARPNEAGVAELKSATLELPDGTVLDVGTASTRAIRQAAATLRRARGAKRGRTVTRDEQAKSKALAKHLAGIPALAGARVDLIAMSKERGADVRIRVPLAALRTLGRALVAHTKAK